MAPSPPPSPLSRHPLNDARSQPTLRLHTAPSSAPPNARLPPPVTRPAQLSAAKYAAPASWHSDAYTLAHNAIKRQLASLYDIMDSIASRIHHVVGAELDTFARWWRVLEPFITEYFDFEADVLLNWAAADPSALAHLKHLCLDHIRQLCGTFELRRYVDPTDLFCTIVREVNALVPHLLHYMSALDAHLSPLIRARHSPQSVVALTRSYVAYVKKGENPHVHLVLLTTWMKSRVKDKWINTYVRGFSRLLFRRWERYTARTHIAIVAAFRTRAVKEARRTAASRIRRRTEFGEHVDDVSFGSMPSVGGSIRSLNVAVARVKRDLSRSANRFAV
ncbi:hypothetical protein BWQ96_04337 [Gracilariopsis chorda]|uniref:Uncharacterized protein n=1 Tax=Gracilariopsis chorda TaxID=448386 RepID=A0A2V3IUV6_9FLOR|nr:hypothetical protein BWQ96_04337 [Gracilariopsis chorda]|eukprot:PXF45902.1 hypothetical protein BWQ96_04337 [Gracilariopsis chorda]